MTTKREVREAEAAVYESMRLTDEMAEKLNEQQQLVARELAKAQHLRQDMERQERVTLFAQEKLQREMNKYNIAKLVDQVLGADPNRGLAS